MPLISVKLGELIKTKMIENLSSIDGVNPSAQSNPEYFNAFCFGIANGIANGTKGLAFKTLDTGLINPLGGSGIGLGKSINFNSEYMIKTAYENIRSEVIDIFGKTVHDPYPPTAKNSGQYLLAIIKSVSESIKEMFLTDLVLTSQHFPVCSGTGIIEMGGFNGLSADTIKQLILSAVPLFKGQFWPNFVTILVNSYVDTVHNHSTASVVITGAGSAPGVGMGYGSVI